MANSLKTSTMTDCLRGSKRMCLDESESDATQSLSIPDALVITSTSSSGTTDSAPQPSSSGTSLPSTGTCSSGARSRVSNARTGIYLGGTETRLPLLSVQGTIKDPVPTDYVLEKLTIRSPSTSLGSRRVLMNLTNIPLTESQALKLQASVEQVLPPAQFLPYQNKKAVFKL